MIGIVQGHPGSIQELGVHAAPVTPALCPLGKSASPSAHAWCIVDTPDILFYLSLISLSTSCARSWRYKNKEWFWYFRNPQDTGRQTYKQIMPCRIKVLRKKEAMPAQKPSLPFFLSVQTSFSFPLLLPSALCVVSLNSPTPLFIHTLLCEALSPQTVLVTLPERIFQACVVQCALLLMHFFYFYFYFCGI